MAVRYGPVRSPLVLGPALWLDDTGSDPSVWSDISGNNRHATESTVSFQPTITGGVVNNRQVRRFNGTKRLTVADQTWQPYTIFSVTKCSQGGGLQTIFRHGGTAQTFNHRFNVNRLESYNNAGSLQLLTAVDTTTWKLLVSVFGPSSLTQYSDGATIATDTGTRSSPFSAASTIGHNFGDYFYGDIAEIIVFPTALSTADRQAVETFLNNKYQIY